MGNKRKESRVIERNNVSIKPYFPTKNNTGINAFTRDLSLGGARIFTKELYEVGSIIKIQIELAGTNELISLEGEVRCRTMPPANSCNKGKWISSSSAATGRWAARERSPIKSALTPRLCLLTATEFLSTSPFRFLLLTGI